MVRTGRFLTTMVALTLGACVTINVYFPAAAAEKAADRIIDEVWGEQAARKALPQPPKPQSVIPESVRSVFVAVLGVVIPNAAAQANLDISTPAVKKITASMAKRHKSLARFYAAGAVGLTKDGLVVVRDAKALSLKDRPAANELVASENRDRNALYAAIAQANSHPEWEPDIRATFARRWIKGAKQGWYYESAGSWRQR